MQNKEGDNNKEASAPDSDNDHAKLQDINLKRKFKAKSQIVAHSEVFSEKNDDWLFDHTKFILRIGNDYFAASSQQRESQLKNLDRSSPDLTLIPRHHYCPEFKQGISKAPDTLSLHDVYLKRPSLISWDAKDPNPTSIADLVLQEADIFETLKKHPHPKHRAIFRMLRLRGEKMGDKRGTFGWELEQAELAALENDFHGLKRLKEYIVHNR
ncbi:serine threonine kinase [Fusarium pseudocircinatum]|uniref:Serine threonine kinase n=1 Tax=Fusarium pseudocircinatum TaxID=56676 RepID=A0A8H5NRJ0_9HYPO|nr:serine threonine kinase [Fusarium pseudocircinatum]